MGSVLASIDDDLAGWLRDQHVFFVATAPNDPDHRINLSPKGLAGTFAVMGGTQVAYLDLTGSGVETIAHLQENGRIALMFCAFEKRPRIVRLHGRGRTVLPVDADFAHLMPLFEEHPGIRSIIVVDVDRISDSCGYGVPTMEYVGDRPILDADARKKGEEAMADYRRRNNATSIDGLPGLMGSDGAP